MSTNKKTDPDLLALKQCIRALSKCTSRRMLRANLDFLFDKFITHPDSELPERLRFNQALYEVMNAEQE